MFLSWLGRLGVLLILLAALLVAATGAGAAPGNLTWIPPLGAQEVAISDDGETVVLNTEDGVVVRDLATADEQTLASNGAGIEISADGTHVAFWTVAQLDPVNDTDAARDLYVVELSSGDATLAATSLAGEKAVEDGGLEGRVASLSADGTRIAFASKAANLHPDDTDADGEFDIFVKDLVTGDIFLASSTDEGLRPPGFGANSAPSLSADGTKVAFTTLQALDPADAGPLDADVYLKNVTTGDIALVGPGGAASLSGDGDKVAFASFESLDAADTDPSADVYVKDIVADTLTLASATDSGVDGNDASTGPIISSDGARVAFGSAATNLDPGDTDAIFDVFVKDLDSGDLQLASVTGSGVKLDRHSLQSDSGSAVLSVSADGSRVLFTSRAGNIPGASPGPGLKAVLKELLPFGGPPPSADDDGDGVPDEIDSDGGAGTAPAGFSDVTGAGVPTTGEVLSGSVSVVDVADPSGVRITGGAGGAVLSPVCGSAFELGIPAGGSVTITCHSIEVEDVTGGPVTVTVPGGAVVTFPNGTSGTVDATASGGAVVTGVTGDGVTMTAGGIATPITSGNSLTLIIGGPGSNTINGTPGDDLIVDSGGNNTIDGKAGNDTIVSGSGNDTVTGGTGDDTINAGNGNNVVNAGAGKDQITTGSGNDTIDGGTDNDTVNAGNGNNVITAGAGNDQITTGSGNDTIDGGTGFDTCHPGSGSNKVKNCEA
jgi:Tol biopolymer transport system component